jgi:hypothetical protein
MRITEIPPTTEELERRLAPVRAAALTRIAQHDRNRNRLLVGSSIGVVLLGASLVVAGTTFNPAIAAPGDVAPEYQHELADCMDARGWEPLPGDSSGESYFHFEFAASRNVEWADDMTACFAEVAEANGVDNVFLH